MVATAAPKEWPTETTLNPGLAPNASFIFATTLGFTSTHAWLIPLCTVQPLHMALAFTSPRLNVFLMLARVCAPRKDTTMSFLLRSTAIKPVVPVPAGPVSEILFKVVNDPCSLVHKSQVGCLDGYLLDESINNSMVSTGRINTVIGIEFSTGNFRLFNIHKISTTI